GYLPSSIFYLLFFLLALCWSVTRWLHEANPVWRMTSWALALEAVGLTLLVLWCVLENSRFQLSDFVFPVCFFLVAVPWPSPVELRLTDTLTQGNVAVTTELLNFLGIPALQKGNVIEVATGLVGVDEACSGIRSFQSTLMIALFFGELYRLTVARRMLSVLAGFVFAFIFNIGRTSLLVYVAARDGIPAMHKWHDPAGIIILVGCFASVWLFCGRMRSQKSEVRSQKSAGEKPETRNPPVAPKQSEDGKPETNKLPMRLAVGLGIWFVLTEAGIEF
ncbi:MAG: exosortase/archaeosortase family protein, partial [Verrucomicrobia bacterium]|nr:exosortase/archaeosortase family protein [Verrucomicrobiota bacterium]